MNRTSLQRSALLIAATAGTAFGQFSFSGPTNYNTPQRPDGVAIGNWDGVNGNDLAVATDNLDKISILTNTGSGTFTGPVDIFTGANTGPGFIAAANFVGGPAIDLAVALQNSNSVMVLQGNGAGGFASVGTFPVGSNPRYIVARDFDGSGSMDMAVVNRDGNSVTILMNTGGSFAASTVAVGDEPRAVAAGEFTGDGNLDLVVTNHRDRNISILAGNGAGGFAPAGTLLVNQATRPEGIIAGDLDGDGDDDVATATGDPDFVSVFLNNGGLGARIDYPSGGVGVGDLAAGDLDGDGDLDLVAVNEDSANMSVMANNGAGGFGAAQILTLGANPSHVAIGDLGGSSAMDIVATSRDSNFTTVYLNDAADDCVADFNGDGNVNTQDVLSFLNAWNAGSGTADINGDGNINTQDVLAFLNLWNAGC